MAASKAKGRKIGRNKPKCERYRARAQRQKNKAARIERDDRRKNPDYVPRGDFAAALAEKSPRSTRYDDLRAVGLTPPPDAPSHMQPSNRRGGTDGAFGDPDFFEDRKAA